MKTIKRGFAPFIAPILAAIALLFPPQAKAICPPQDFLGAQMLTAMCYECMLPIHIFGVPVMEGYMPSKKDPMPPFMVCSIVPPIAGFPVGLYEPAMAVEVVNDPMCFPTLGGGSSAAGGSAAGLFEAGSKGDAPGDKEAFYQTHIITTPLLEILGLFNEICPLAKATDFDISSMSELYPQWQDDALASIIYPEALLYAAPPLTLACMADSAAAQVYTPIDSLYWCKGAWGGVYPLSGTTLNKSLIEDTASIGANAVYFGHRNNFLWKTWGAEQLCAGRLPLPFWEKSAYRMQLMSPVPHPLASQIGEAGLVKLWTSGKWIPNAGDNFTYLLFRKTDCLVIVI